MRKILEFIKAHMTAFAIGIGVIATAAVVTVVAVQGNGKENKTDVAVNETKGQKPTEGETASETDGETSGEGITEPEYETYVDVVDIGNGETETVYVPLLPGETAPETKPAVKPSEPQTEKVTEKATEKQTEAPTVKPTEAPTQKPTEAPTVKPTEAPTVKPTEAPKPLTAGEKFLAEGGTYTDNGDGTITLTKWVNASGDVVIPSEVDGKTVTAIAHRFFIETNDDSNTGITSITVPGTVKRIDKGQFWNCTNLKKLTFKEGVEIITGETCRGCLKLTEVYVPSTVTVFSGCLPGNNDYYALDLIMLHPRPEDYIPYVPAATITINNSYGNVWTIEDPEYRELFSETTFSRVNTTVIYLK